MISCLSTRRCKEVVKYTKHPGQQKKFAEGQYRSRRGERKLQEEIRQKEERHLFLSNKIDKNKMQDAEMAAELQSLQAGEERRGSDASQTGACCLEALWQQMLPCVLQWVRTRTMPWPMLCSKVQRKWSNPGADARKRRKKKE